MKNRKMQFVSTWIRTLAIFITISLSPHVYGALTILSSDLHIYGNWHAQNRVGGENYNPIFAYASDTFNSASTDGTPISMGASAPWGGAHATSSLDSFNLAMAAQAPAYLGSEEYSTINIYTEAFTRFQSDSTQLAISLRSSAYYRYPQDQKLQVNLTDITSGTTLLDINCLVNYEMVGVGMSTSLDKTFTVDIDPSHIYAFLMSGVITAYDTTDSRMSVSAQIEGVAVPEPSTYLAGALLLLPFVFQGARRLRSCKP